MPLKFRNRFQFVTVAGLINNNHLDFKIIEQMLIALKPGGHMVFSARFSYLRNYWYTHVLDDLEKAGRIKFIENEEFFKYGKLN